jgi:hypothetical protein
MTGQRRQADPRTPACHHRVRSAFPGRSRRARPFPVCPGRFRCARPFPVCPGRFRCAEAIPACPGRFRCAEVFPACEVCPAFLACEAFPAAGAPELTEGTQSATGPTTIAPECPEASTGGCWVPQGQVERSWVPRGHYGWLLGAPGPSRASLGATAPIRVVAWGPWAWDVWGTGAGWGGVGECQGHRVAGFLEIGPLECQRGRVTSNSSANELDLVANLCSNECVFE